MASCRRCHPGVELIATQPAVGSGRYRRRTLAALVVAVALAAAGASFAFIDDRGGALVAVLLALTAIALLIVAWVKVGPAFAAPLLALAQGMAWFFLLIHGGLGLFLGPMGWLAAVIAGRLPLVASALLAGPVVLIVWSWLPGILTGDLALREGLALAALTVPALVGAAVLFRIRASAPAD